MLLLASVHDTFPKPDSKKKKKKKARVSSDAERYKRDLCKWSNGKVSRWNADTRGPDPVRSEGKVRRAKTEEERVTVHLDDVTVHWTK